MKARHSIFSYICLYPTYQSINLPMKKILLIVFCCIAGLSVKAQTLETFHDFMGIGIMGDTINFSDYAGKKVLVVNTASFCGFTPQFDNLAELDSLYGGPGFAIIGFPCNDFGHQEPGNLDSIKILCRLLNDMFLL